MKDYTLEKRKYVIGAAAIVIVLIYVFRLFDLQIMTDDYKKNADSNAFLNKIQYPSRGAIYDRNGKLLVFNQPAYDITFVPREVTQLDTLDLCSALNITREQFDKRMKDVKNRWMNPGYSKYTHQVFMTQLSAEECGVFQEKLFKFPGFYIQRRTIRQYTYNSAGHLLGDIGEVSKKDIENDDYYIRGDYIGKQGIEKSYEKYLRGEKGVEILLRDAHGRIQGHYMDGQLDRSSVPGKNLTLGIDIDLQMLGERLLQHKIGAIVAIEPATGEILCMVSSPTFDPHLMIGRQRGKNYVALQKDPLKPLFNRPLMAQYPPGSTFKPVTAVAGLEEGVISPSEIIHATGVFTDAYGSPTCWIYNQYHGSHGNINMVDAIRVSCNYYFYEVGFRLGGGRSTGYSSDRALAALSKYAAMFGFDHTSGMELPESDPKISDSDGIRSAIGQGTHLYTVSQIARYVSTIANRGTVYDLTLLDKLTDSEGKTIDDYSASVYNNIDIADNSWNTIQEGMHQVAENTAAFKDLNLTIAGKTGTAQQSKSHPNHALFMGYAPYESPQIAIAIRIANGYTSANAASMAADIFSYYFDLTDKDELLNGSATTATSAVIND